MYLVNRFHDITLVDLYFDFRITLQRSDQFRMHRSRIDLEIILKDDLIKSVKMIFRRAQYLF